MRHLINAQCGASLPSWCKCIVALLLGVMGGCGTGGHDLVPVAGRVMVDGNPVSTGRIEFFPESGRPSIGTINDEGRYTLTTYESGDGARPGKYLVTITSRNIPEEAPAYKSFEDELRGITAIPDQSQKHQPSAARITWLVPPKYSSRTSSELTAEVVDGGEEIDFQLKSKP